MTRKGATRHGSKKAAGNMSIAHPDGDVLMRQQPPGGETTSDSNTGDARDTEAESDKSVPEIPVRTRRRKVCVADESPSLPTTI